MNSQATRSFIAQVRWNEELGTGDKKETNMELREKAEELRRYAELEGTELGEFWNALIAAAYRADYAGGEFSKAIDKELTAQLEYVAENATIVEREETFTRKVADLEWD